MSDLGIKSADTWWRFTQLTVAAGGNQPVPGDPNRLALTVGLRLAAAFDPLLPGQLFISLGGNALQRPIRTATWGHPFIYLHRSEIGQLVTEQMTLFALNEQFICGLWELLAYNK
jgi:hypothetical protein